MNREQLNYKRMVTLLGQLEDKLGYSKDFERYEALVHNAVDKGKNHSFVINTLSKALDSLESESSVN